MSAMPAETFDAARPPAVAVVDLDRRVQLALAEAMRAAGVEVVGTAGDFATALDLLADGAEVVLVDPRLPDIATGQALMSTIGRDWPDVRIVVMGWGDSGESAMVGDVRSFINKSASPEEFVAAALEACGAP